MAKKKTQRQQTRLSRRQFLERVLYAATGVAVVGTGTYIVTSQNKPESQASLEELYQQARKDPSLRPYFVEEAVKQVEVPEYVKRVAYISEQPEDGFLKEAFMFTKTVKPVSFKEGELEGRDSLVFVYPNCFSGEGLVATFNDVLSCLEIHEFAHARINKQGAETFRDFCLRKDGIYDHRALRIFHELESYKHQITTEAKVGERGISIPRMSEAATTAMFVKFMEEIVNLEKLCESEPMLNGAEIKAKVKEYKAIPQLRFVEFEYK